MGLYFDDETSEEESEGESVNGVDTEIATISAPGKEDLDREWVVSIKQKIDTEPGLIKTSSTSISCSIYRVPKSLHQHDKSTYEPQVISIGPLHYAKRTSSLQAMEEHKWRYLQALLTREGDDCLERYLIAIKELEKRARESYSEEIHLDSNSFVEMMVLDGCFIIELFQRALYRIYKDDPIFNLEWLRPAITKDLLMLENQIPFFVLQHLFRLIKSYSRPSLKYGAVSFFRSWHFFKNLIPVTRSISGHSNTKVHHLLHLIHSKCLPFPLSENENPRSGHVKIIPCASELKKAGIRFQKGDEARSLRSLNIKFQKGVIEIPYMTIQGMTYTTLLNLVAFEQCYRHCKSYFTGYIYFMDCLIDSAKDVEILCQDGIMDHWLGSNGDVATLFNTIGRQIALDTKYFYLGHVCKEINRHYGKVWPRLQATLKRDYFKSPWAIISFLAAVILLLLTFSQSLFTAFPGFAFRK